MVSPALSPGEVSDVVAGDEAVGAVLDVDDDWDLKGATGIEKVDEWAVKCRL